MPRGWVREAPFGVSAHHTTPPHSHKLPLAAMSVLCDPLALVDWEGLGHSPGSCGLAVLYLVRATSFQTGSLDGEECNLCREK